MNTQCEYKNCLIPPDSSIEGQRVRLFWVISMLGFFLFSASPAMPEGFRNSPAGAFNLGRAGGRIAQIDDSSAVAQNPGNLVEIPQSELQLTPTFGYYNTDFKSPIGQRSQTEDPWKILPNLFASTPFSDGKYAFGFGFTTPYGIGSKWDVDSSAFAFPNGQLRYTSPHFAELKAFNFNPSFAANLFDRFNVGVGLDVMWSELTLKQFFPWFLPPLGNFTQPEGNVRLKGDGVGYGGNVGVTWKITDKQRLAATYRSPVSVDYDGSCEINNITPVGAFLGATPESGFSTKVNFPTIVAVGYGIQLTDTIRLESNVEWLQFSRFKSLDLNVKNNSVLFPSTSFAQNWNDTFTVGIGGDWRFAPNWILRAGYQFYESPVPDNTFSPTIPDANQNVVTVGLGYTYKGHSFEVAYGADFYDERKISNNQNPAFNGTYDVTLHIISCAYRFRF